MAYSLGNRFTPRDLYHYDYKWQVEVGIHAPLTAVDEDICEIPTLWRLKKKYNPWN
jgi:hypothetical protein